MKREYFRFLIRVFLYSVHHDPIPNKIAMRGPFAELGPKIVIFAKKYVENRRRQRTNCQELSEEGKEIVFIVRFNTACTGNQLSVGRSFGAEIGESRGQTLWAISAAVMGRAEIIYKGKGEFALFFLLHTYKKD